MITVQRLREVLGYDPETGLFRWKLKISKKVVVGEIAGTEIPGRHRYISIDSKRYKAHRLAWLYMTGEWPPRDLDHENTHKGDNRWENLRKASRSQNMANAGHRNNATRLKGAYPCRKRFAAKITKDWKQIHIGVFDTAEEAHAAYIAKAEELFGEFARAA